MSRIISGEAEEGEEGETQLYSMSKPLKGKTPTKDTNQHFTVGTRCYDRIGGKYLGGEEGPLGCSGSECDRSVRKSNPL